MSRNRLVALLSAVLVLVTLIYANHFNNSFHFDDSHSIVENPYIRSLSNLPRFFTDTSTSSVLPPNRTFRPLLYCSLALDYALGNSLKPFYFHLTTFVFYLAQLCLMFVLFRRVFDKARPDPRNVFAALFATAFYGVHPAMAETVNYIIQRADMYSTLAVVGSLVVWICFPGQRKYGFYLAILVAGALFKPPALIFCAMLWLYIVLIDGESAGSALRRSVPTLVTVGVLIWISVAMTPPTFVSGAVSGLNYRITQPAVIFHYFRSFFAPFDLSADSARTAFDSILNGEAIFGFVFLAGLIALAVRCTGKREYRPIAFGIWWFLLAVLPTSLQALAEVENDHRMFFPFVGLAMSAGWAGALWVYSRPLSARVVALVCAAVLLGFGWGTRERNKVWLTEETLWFDVTQKSPTNGRGLMNYGLSQMAKGESVRALDYFQRALVYTPNYYVLEANLGIVLGVLHRDAEAEQHFRRAAELNPTEATSHYFYARWLNQRGRTSEAIAHLETIIRNNPSYIDAPHLLMLIYSEVPDAEMLRKTASETLARFPDDAAAATWQASAGSLKPTPDNYLNKSLAFYQQGRFEDSIRAAQEALKLRPGYAAAWNNIAAAYNSQGKWDEGIAAGEKAVQLDPSSQLSKNNLSWGKSQKALADAKKTGGRVAGR